MRINKSTRRLRFLFETKSGSTPKSSVQEYWDGDINWVTPEDLGKLEGREIYSTKRRISNKGYQSCGVSLASVGSIVLSKRAPIGQAAILKVESACNQGCFLLTPKEDLDERFYYYFLVSIRPNIEVLGRGSTFMELSADDLRSISLPFLPKNEQKEIANYLDRETAEIDALVAEKERMLTLLEEKRQALISHIVTRGLDPSAPLKPSGLPWLGDIPHHWEIRRLKFLSRSLEQGSSPVASNVPAQSDELGVLKLSAISKGKFIGNENKALRESEDSIHSLSLKCGDILITRGNTPKLVGDVCMVPQDEPNLLISDLIYRLRVKHYEILPGFLAFYLLTSQARSQIESDARGSSGSMVKISQGHIFDWYIPLPPKVEQQDIVNTINQEQSKNEDLRNELIKSVSLLKERRSALITAVVTGQIPLEEMAA